MNRCGFPFVCFWFLAVVSLPLFLSGCTQEENATDLNDFDGSTTPAASTNGAARVITVTSKQAEKLFTIATTTSSGSIVENTFAETAGSVKVTVPSAATFVEDKLAIASLIQGIADAHKVPPSYVSINITRVGDRRLAPTSLRRLVHSLQIDYTISVPSAEEPSIRKKMVERASSVTLIAMQEAIKSRLQTLGGDAFATSIGVMSVSVPKTIIAAAVDATSSSISIPKTLTTTNSAAAFTTEGTTIS